MKIGSESDVCNENKTQKSKMLHYISKNRLYKLPLYFNGSHGFICKITFVVDLNSFADKLQTFIQILFPLKLK